MRTFRITEKIEIVCEWKKTRTAFKHEATLLLDGKEVDSDKVCYQNRTWEKYEFETVMRRLVRRSEFLSEAEKKTCNDFLDGDLTDWSQFRAVSSIAMVGELMCDNQKDKNDWKARMIKAGLGDAIQMPDDWNSLNEDEKERRLNMVIEQMAGAGKQ